MEKKNNEKVVTRAEKRDATKNLIKEVLTSREEKANELIDKASKIYIERFPGEETENVNDVKGRIGSVIDVMKKEGEILFDGGVYALKAEEKPAKKTRKVTKKAEKAKEEKPKKRSTATAKTKENQKEKEETEEVLPLPTAPIQPIVPVAPITPEVAPEPIPEDKPKKRAVRKAKKVEEAEEVVSENKEESKIERRETIDKELEKEEKIKTQSALMDVSFLLGKAIKPQKTESAEKTVEVKKEPIKEKEEQQKPLAKTSPQKRVRSVQTVRRVIKTLTPEEKLKEAFLSRLHKLGGEYFEYFSVYLLEKYSRKNGRRLESLKVTAGDHDGGIDGEIELTDKLGFRETIYIQAKNWDPSKGDEKLWVVGETLLQQFIGACVCRQAKEGKQHCRGIFITTSRFTLEAKKILEDTSDKFVGYDGGDLYETAKECAFGIIKKNGEYVLDESLLSGTKAFFNMD